MKNIKLSLVTLVSLSTLVFAGGDIAPLEPIVDVPQTEDMVVSKIKSGFYASLALAATSTRESDTSLNFFSEEDGQDRMGNFTLTAGYDFNKYVAVEGRFTTSFTKEEITEMQGFSIFVKPQYPITKKFSVYGLLGFGSVKLEGVDNTDVDVDDNGFQWGLGASYAINDDFSIYADYTSLAKDMDGTYLTQRSADTDALTIGITYNF